MRRASRRDENEAAIVEALESAGASVLRVSSPNAPDLIVGFRGETVLLEIKRPVGPRGGTKGRKLLPGQKAFADSWRGGTLRIARSPQDALESIGCGAMSDGSGTVCPGQRKADCDCGHNGCECWS